MSTKNITIAYKIGSSNPDLEVSKYVRGIFVNRTTEQTDDLSIVRETEVDLGSRDCSSLDFENVNFDISGMQCPDANEFTI